MPLYPDLVGLPKTCPSLEERVSSWSRSSTHPPRLDVPYTENDNDPDMVDDDDLTATKTEYDDHDNQCRLPEKYTWVISLIETWNASRNQRLAAEANDPDYNVEVIARNPDLEALHEALTTDLELPTANTQLRDVGRQIQNINVSNSDLPEIDQATNNGSSFAFSLGSEPEENRTDVSQQEKSTRWGEEDTVRIERKRKVPDDESLSEKDSYTSCSQTARRDGAKRVESGRLTPLPP